MDEVRIGREALEGFCAGVFACYGVADEDARAAARVLVAADVRGIDSHGVGRLWRYVNGLKTKQMLPDARPCTLQETNNSLVVDARSALGQPVSCRTMERVIAKAADQGAAFACVRNSNHFGIAGYYAMMALPHDMIGLAMSNTAALAVPTFGSRAMFGTNPLAFAAPAAREGAFVLDMATTATTRGKVELYRRLGQELLPGWAVHGDGQSAVDAGRLLKEMLPTGGGGLLPLGGAGESHGGHKGYGLAVMVDILCSLLCGAPFGPELADTETSFTRMNHFFGAISISRFRDPAAFRADMDRMLAGLRATPPVAGEERVYFAGLKERESEEEAARLGIRILAPVYRELSDLAGECGLEPPAIAG
jgi:L-2-hydroxycarboxylate dehydrogenase (NAD+)